MRENGSWLADKSANFKGFAELNHIMIDTPSEKYLPMKHSILRAAGCRFFVVKARLSVEHKKMSLALDNKFVLTPLPW